MGVGNFGKSESWVGNFGKVAVGVGYFTSDSAIQFQTTSAIGKNIGDRAQLQKSTQMAENSTLALCRRFGSAWILLVWSEHQNTPDLFTESEMKLKRKPHTICNYPSPSCWRDKGQTGTTLKRSIQVVQTKQNKPISFCEVFAQTPVGLESNDWMKETVYAKVHSFASKSPNSRNNTKQPRATAHEL